MVDETASGRIIILDKRSLNKIKTLRGRTRHKCTNCCGKCVWWLNIRQQQSSHWSQRFRQDQKSTEEKESCGRTRTIIDTTILKTELWTVGDSYSKTGIPKSSVHRVWTGMIEQESSMTMQDLTAQTIKTVFTDYNWETLPHLTTGNPCPTLNWETAPPHNWEPLSTLNWEPLPHLTTENPCPTLQLGTTAPPYNWELLAHLAYSPDLSPLISIRSESRKNRCLVNNFGL
jgi:hypothetical protein